MASLGQDLKRERELRGISLKEIADATRISLKFLQALEEDHLEIIPGKFFVRAILRSYAKSIGVDENQLLNKYQEMLLYDEDRLDKEPRQRLNPPRILTPKRMLILLFALVVVVMAALLYYVFISSPGKRALPPKPKPQSFSPTLPPNPVQPPAQEPAVEEVKGLNLKISILEETWIQLYADGKRVWDGIKAAGEVLNVKAEQELVFNVGNAGGLAFTINGKKARPFGPMGAVRKDIKITLDNYHEYLLSDKENKS